MAVVVREPPMKICRREEALWPLRRRLEQPQQRQRIGRPLNKMKR
jgi:hypothetical protein